MTLGAVSIHFWEKRHTDEPTRRTGTLLASGFIVGESLFGVALAGLIVASGQDEPLALVGDSFAGPATLIGIALFVGTLVALYRWAGKAGSKLAVGGRPGRKGVA